MTPLSDEEIVRRWNEIERLARVPDSRLAYRIAVALAERMDEIDAERRRRAVIRAIAQKAEGR